jgi:ABC-2 type transport system ATP-binding protein
VDSNFVTFFLGYSLAMTFGMMYFFRPKSLLVQVVPSMIPSYSFLNFLGHHKAGISDYILISFVMGSLNFAALMVVEYNVLDIIWTKIIYSCGFYEGFRSILNLQKLSGNQPRPHFLNVDPKVKEDSDKINGMSHSELSQYKLIFKEVRYQVSEWLNLQSNCFSMIVENSSIFGIICSEKSMKSLIFNSLFGLETRYKGNIYFMAQDLKNLQSNMRKKIGYCSEECMIQKFLTGRQNLRILGLIKGLKPGDLEEEIKELEESLSLKDFLDKPVKNYTERNRKILGIAMAFIGNPELIILDEPFMSLDLEMKQIVIKMLEKMRNLGKTILILSCSFKEYEGICSKVAIFDDKLKFLDTPQKIKARFKGKVDIRIEYKILENDYSIQSVDDLKNLIGQEIPYLGFV